MTAENIAVTGATSGDELLRSIPQMGEKRGHSEKSWQSLASGIVHALVNGTIAVNTGRYTGVLAGRGHKLDRGVLKR